MCLKISDDSKNFRINFRFAFSLLIGILIGFLSFGAIGLFAETNSSTSLGSKPTMVNVQVDVENESDQNFINDILKEIEILGWRASVFVTGELASNNPSLVRYIETRGHEIAVHGWSSEDDLSQLNYEEQLNLVERSFAAVRNAVNNPERVKDFKPQGYAFNDYTIKVLQDLEIRSITGLFKCTDLSCKCWYAQELGEITFPYPINTEFTAVPISKIEVDAEELPLDDKHIFEVIGAAPDDYLEYLLRGYEEKKQTKEPLIINIHASITGTDSARINAFSDFLTTITDTEGKLTVLGQLTHHTPYITNFNASGPSSASIGEEMSITITYTSNIWCPKYRFRAYGKYPGEEWKLLDSDCYYVYLGNHSFDLTASIPEPPEDDNVYTIRLVGMASFGSCDLSDPNWPTYDSYEVMDEIDIEVIDYKLKLLFVPLSWSGTQDDFDSEVDDQIAFFLDNVPLENCPEQVKVEKLSVTTQNFSGFTCSSSNCGVSSIKPFVRGLEIDPADYDIIVGVVESTPCSPIAGCSNGGDTIWVTSDYDVVTAHEIGHIYDLEDEYCSNQAGSTDCRCNDGGNEIDICTDDINTLDASASRDCPPDGSDDSNGDPCCNFDESHDCADVDYGVCCYGNKNSDGGRCVMSYANASDPRAYCTSCITHLNSLSKLECESNTSSFASGNEFSSIMSSDKVLDINLLIYQDDSVAVETINITEGRVTSESIIQSQMGEYTITVEGDEVLWSQSFDLYFDYKGPVVLDVDYSGINYESFYLSYRIPYEYKMQMLKLYHGDNLIFTETLPISVISGTVTDFNGVSVSNALVQISGTSEDSILTIDDGTYNFTGLEPGVYTITVTPPIDANLMPASRSVSVLAGQTIIEDFILQSAGSIRGTVTDADGEPVPNVHLYLSGYEPPRYATDNDGRYIVPALPAGSYTLNIDAPDYGSWYIWVNDFYSNYGTSVSLEVVLSQTVRVDFNLQPPPSPDISVDPEFFDLTIPQSSSTTETLTVSNDGEEVLEFDITDYLGVPITDPSEGGTADIKQVIMNITPTEAIFMVETYVSVTEFGIYLWLDTDQDQSTGVTDFLWPDFGLNDIGADYVVYGGVGPGGQYGELYRWNGAWFDFVSGISVNFNDSFLILTFPSSDLSGDGNMDVTIFMEGYDGYYGYDIAPDSGHGTTGIGPDWLSESPMSGIVNPGDGMDIELLVDTIGIQPGVYGATIIISSNDIDESLLAIPVNLTVKETIIIDGCNTKVENKLLDDVSKMSDLIAECADSAKNHGKFVSCVSHITNDWKKQGLISGKEKGAIQSCAAQADIP